MLKGISLAVVSAIIVAFCNVLSRSLKETPAPVIIFHHAIGGIIFAFAYISIECLVTGQATRLREYTG